MNAYVGDQDGQKDVEEALEVLRRIAGKMVARSAGRLNFDDLVERGLEVLTRALRDHDPLRCPFLPYVSQRFQWSMLDHRRRLSRRLKPERGAPAWFAKSIHSGGGRQIGVDGTSTSLLTQGTGLQGTSAAGGIAALAVADEPNPEQHLQEKRRAHAITCAVAKALKDLPDLQQILVRRHYFEGEAFADVANDIGVSRWHACRLHRRALKALREKLKPFANPCGNDNDTPLTDNAA